MYVASMKRRATVAGSAASTRCAAEAPLHRCPVAGLSKTVDSRNPPPYFCASLGQEVVKVEVRSGCEINKISESKADDLGLDIVIDEYGYNDYVVNVSA